VLCPGYFDMREEIGGLVLYWWWIDWFIVLGNERQYSCLPGKCSTTWATLLSPKNHSILTLFLITKWQITTCQG
jgi:hypothetical protein